MTWRGLFYCSHLRRLGGLERVGLRLSGGDGGVGGGGSVQRREPLDRASILSLCLGPNQSFNDAFMFPECSLNAVKMPLNTP